MKPVHFYTVFKIFATSKLGDLKILTYWRCLILAVSTRSFKVLMCSHRGYFKKKRICSLYQYSKVVCPFIAYCITELESIFGGLVFV